MKFVIVIARIYMSRDNNDDDDGDEHARIRLVSRRARAFGIFAFLNTTSLK